MRGAPLAAAAAAGRASNPAGKRSTAPPAAIVDHTALGPAQSQTREVRGVRLAPGRGGILARQHVERAEHPFILVQDKSGERKPLYHEFHPRDGFSTVPMLMHGHPDDTTGGHLIMSEYDVHVRKQKEKRKAARAAGGDDEPPRREQRPERPERGGRQGGSGGASSSQAEQGTWAEIDEEIRKTGTRVARWCADGGASRHLGM